MLWRWARRWFVTAFGGPEPHVAAKLRENRCWQKSGRFTKPTRLQGFGETEAEERHKWMWHHVVHLGRVEGRKSERISYSFCMCTPDWMGVIRPRSSLLMQKLVWHVNIMRTIIPTMPLASPWASCRKRCRRKKAKTCHVTEKRRANICDQTHTCWCL